MHYEMIVLLGYINVEYPIIIPPKYICIMLDVFIYQLYKNYGASIVLEKDLERIYVYSISNLRILKKNYYKIFSHGSLRSEDRELV